MDTPGMKHHGRQPVRSAAERETGIRGDDLGASPQLLEGTARVVRSALHLDYDPSARRPRAEVQNDEIGSPLLIGESSAPVAVDADRAPTWR